MFGCKHDYELIDKTVLESGYEQAVKNGSVVDHVDGPEWSSFFTKKLILTFKCSICKKIKTVESSNP